MDYETLYRKYQALLQENEALKQKFDFVTCRAVASLAKKQHSKIHLKC